MTIVAEWNVAPAVAAHCNRFPANPKCARTPAHPYRIARAQLRTEAAMRGAILWRRLGRLLLAEGVHGLEAGGAEGGSIAGGERDQGEEGGGGAQR
jgi:hypothetical protein